VPDVAVQIVIPARNEEGNVERCVRAALDAMGVSGVVVVDDESEDRTAEIAIRAGGGDPRLAVVQAPARPAGWSGKSWALWHGKTGEEPWLLFVDADVRVAPDAAIRAVVHAELQGLDLFSAFGRWETPDLGTTVLVPAFGWTVRGLIQPDEVENGRRPFANGQFLLVRRSAYERAGGHAAVASSVLDDVELARVVQRTGGKVGVGYAPSLFSVRPYRSGLETLRGWHKNLATGAGGRGPATVGALTLLAVGPGPVLVLAASVGLGDGVAGAVAVGALVVQVALRARLDGLDGRNPWWAWTHPFGLAVVAAMLLASAWWPASTWKGRRFDRGQAV
jgi:hypothetical protein